MGKIIPLTADILREPLRVMSLGLDQSVPLDDFTEAVNLVLLELAKRGWEISPPSAARRVWRAPGQITGLAFFRDRLFAGVGDVVHEVTLPEA